MQVKDVAFYPNNNGSSCMVSVEKGIIILTWYILETSLSYNVENGIKGARDHCSILCEKRWVVAWTREVARNGSPTG